MEEFQTELQKAQQAILEKRIEYWHRSTGWNRMCYKCPLIGSQCVGSQNDRWVDCTKRNTYERKNGISWN